MIANPAEHAARIEGALVPSEYAAFALELRQGLRPLRRLRRETRVWDGDVNVIHWRQEVLLDILQSLNAELDARGMRLPS